MPLISIHRLFHCVVLHISAYQLNMLNVFLINRPIEVSVSGALPYWSKSVAKPNCVVLWEKDKFVYCLLNKIYIFLNRVLYYIL